MATIIDVAESWGRLSLQTEVPTIIADTSEVYADLNAEQLAQGVRSDGSPITPDYKDSTIERKKQKTGLSAITDRVTLYDEGDFYKGLGITKVDPEKYTITSTDFKAEKLSAKYGEKIFGLTSTNLATYAFGHVLPRIAGYIERITGLKMK